MNTSNSGLLWSNFNGIRKLFTEKSPATKLSEKRLVLWNPYTSKLAAALFNGMEIFPIQPTSKIFYHDDYSVITLEHISNIISSEGVVYFLKNIENKKILNFKNIEIIKGDVVNPDYFVKLKEKIDVIYLDLLSQEKLSTIIKNCTIILRQNGFLILILNDKSPIDDNFGKQIHKIIINLKASFELIQEINLSDFFKNSMMIILQKTD